MWEINLVIRAIVGHIEGTVGVYGLHWSLSVKEPACQADVGLIPGLGRSPREGNGNPLQYSCLVHPMNRGAWWATVHGGHKRVDMTWRLDSSDNPCECVEPALLVRGEAGREGSLKEVLLKCACVQSCLTFMWVLGLLPSRLLRPWNFPSRNTGVGCHFLLQGILPTQGLNLRLWHFLHCGQFLYHWATGDALVSHA